MFLGAHVSIAGGVQQAPARGAALGCTAIQIFTKSQLQWSAPPLSPDAIVAYQQELKAHQIQASCVHDAYLINLGSSDPELLQKSRLAFIDEMQRAHLLNIPFLIFHPGSYKNGEEATCLQTIAESLDYCIEMSGVNRVMPLIETTAGQGKNVGYTFEQLAEIRDRVKTPERIGFCLDTSHIFAAGYDIRTRASYEKTMQTWDAILELDNLKVIHLNDSKKELGSRVDRHENIGLGKIGPDAFQFIMNDPRLAKVQKILETPGGDSWYRKNIAFLRSLVESPAHNLI